MKSKKDEKEKRSDIRFIIFLSVTAIIFFINIIVHQEYSFAIAYACLMPLIIAMLYHNYSWTKRSIQWHAQFRERNPGNGEPSAYNLIIGKIGNWTLIIILMICSICSGL